MYVAHASPDPVHMQNAGAWLACCSAQGMASTLRLIHSLFYTSRNEGEKLKTLPPHCKGGLMTLVDQSTEHKMQTGTFRRLSKAAHHIHQGARQRGK